MTAPEAPEPIGRTPRQVAGPEVEAEREVDAGPTPVLDVRERPPSGSEIEPAEGPDTEAAVEPTQDASRADSDVDAPSDPDPAAEDAPDTDPDADPDPDPDTDPDPDPDTDNDLDPEIGPGDALMGETDGLRLRWEAVQAGFVDDPHRAVEQADEMVSAAVAALQAHIEQRREDLAETWRGGAPASTDALLTAFQRYRSMFEGVLST